MTNFNQNNLHDSALAMFVSPPLLILLSTTLAPSHGIYNLRYCSTLRYGHFQVPKQSSDFEARTARRTEFNPGGAYHMGVMTMDHGFHCGLVDIVLRGQAHIPRVVGSKPELATFEDSFLGQGVNTNCDSLHPGV